MTSSLHISPLHWEHSSGSQPFRYLTFIHHQVLKIISLEAFIDPPNLNSVPLLCPMIPPNSLLWDLAHCIVIACCHLCITR